MNWTSPTTDMMHTSLQNYRDMMVGEYGIQIFEVMVVAFAIVDRCFCPTSNIP